MKNKRLRGGVQNVCLILLTLSALFLLARLPMLREIRLPGQVPALFSPEASPGGQEEAVLPAAMFPSMNLMVTGDSQYGRHGRLCVSADDASLQQITPQFGEALGSASTAERVSDEVFRKALEGPGLYLELTAGQLPLEAAAAWLGERGVDFDQPLRAMALTIGEADAAQLFLLDGQGDVFRYDTALPASAVRTLCESFSPNGGYFSYETASEGVAPYTVLTAEALAPPDLLAELPAGYSVYNLLTALGLNAHTLSRYTESGGAEVVEESSRTLRITPDGGVTLISRGGSALYRASGRGLRETLAAAMVLLSRYRGRDPFCDPFCGSGTIPIEAALIAKNRAPGLNRSFSAQKWEWLDKKHWLQGADEAMDQEFDGNYEIWGGDLDPAAVELARHNAQLAEVDDIVRFDVDDASRFHWGGLRGRVVTNPPYGERVLERREAEELYRKFGTAWNKFPDAWELYLLSSHTEFERTFGKRADKKRKLYNGMLKCDLFMYLPKRR